MCGEFLLTESDRILHKKRPFVGSQFVENSPNDSDYGAAEASVSDQDRHSLAAKRMGEGIREKILRILHHNAKNWKADR